MKHCICFFSGDGTLERKLCALKVNIGCSALKALTRSALGRLGAGKVNGLGSLCRACKQDNFVIGYAENSAAYCGKMVLTLADILHDAFLECTDHGSMVGKHAYVAVLQRYKRIAYH